MAHQNICEHEPCTCTVASGQKFCSDFCRDAGADEVEIACQCAHPACHTEDSGPSPSNV